jgi:hypothetical protein
MQKKEMPVEEQKKPYQKPEMDVHGSLKRITEQRMIDQEGFKMGQIQPSNQV